MQDNNCEPAQCSAVETSTGHLHSEQQIGDRQHLGPSGADSSRHDYQDCIRIFHGFSGGIEKGDLDNRSHLGKPSLA